MGDHRRYGLGRNRTPQEARRELPIPCLLVLLDVARLDFGLSTIPAPADRVFIRASTRTESASSILNLPYRLQDNVVAINGSQWDCAVAPVLERPDFDMTTPLNQSLLATGRVGEILSALGYALEQSFIDCGYGPATLPIFPPDPPIPFTPDQTANLVGNFDASNSATLTLSGTAVRRWENLAVGGGFNASQQNLLDQPNILAAGQNGLDVMVFNGNNQYLDLPFPAGTNYTLFVVGSVNPSATSPIGSFFAATGLEASFGGVDARIYQDNTTLPVGTPLTSVNGSDIAHSQSIGASTFGLMEWSESIDTQNGELEIAVDGDVETVFTGNTSNDYWDPARQLFGLSPPLLASIGRSQKGINPLETFDYLDGVIGEIVIYERVLSEAEREPVRNYLRTKWGI
jgi:hypothetical protein